MKIAILSDIHGNHYALAAVLEEVQTLNVDHLFILGDTVGYYYHPEKVLQYLEDWSKDMIKGNHEELMKDAYMNEKFSKKVINDYGHGIELAIARLEDKSRNNLINLAFRETITLDNVIFELCHGSPWDFNLYIYPDSDIETLNKCGKLNADFVLMGHTHRHFLYCDNTTTILNAGSVGQNREKGGIASWVFLNTQNRTIIFKHTPYPIKNLIKDIKKYDINNEYLINVLKR